MALKVGSGIAAAITAGAITYSHGQRNDATGSTGDQITWNKKVVGTALTTGAAALAGAALVFATKGRVDAQLGAALGAGVMFGGMIGSASGFLGSMAVD